MKLLSENLGQVSLAPDMGASNPQSTGAETRSGDVNPFDEPLRRFLAENGELETIEELTKALQRWFDLESSLEQPE